jgi:hypothetical protein
MPKVRNWETHLELASPSEVFSHVDKDMTDFVRMEKVFKLYKSVAGTRASSSGSAESGAVTPESVAESGAVTPVGTGPGSDY